MGTKPYFLWVFCMVVRRIVDSCPNTLDFSTSCTSNNNKCYAKVDELKSWDEAKTCCEGLAGFLAEAINLEELTALKRVSNSPRMFYWLGGTDRDIDGSWKWDQSGEDIDQTWFKAGEPNGGMRENCLIININVFMDDPCQWNHHFVCQDRVTTTPAPTTPTTTTILTATTLETATPDPCINKVCGSGTCVNGRCNYCQPDPCEAGTCLPYPSVDSSGYNFSFTCQCKDGYTGPKCKLLADDPCQDDPAAVCINGGTCVVKIMPGPNEWICRCPGKPKKGQSKDCSEEKTSNYPIPERAMVAIASVPFYMIGIACAVFCVFDCISIGELPDLDWASESSTSDSDSDSSSEDSDVPESYPTIPRESRDTYSERITDIEELTVMSERGNGLISNKDTTVDLAVSSIKLNKSLSRIRSLVTEVGALQDVSEIKEKGLIEDPFHKIKKQRKIFSFISHIRPTKIQGFSDKIKSKFMFRQRSSREETNKPSSTSETDSYSTAISHSV